MTAPLDVRRHPLYDPDAPVPPVCPSWCDLSPHPYETETAPGSWSRRHARAWTRADVRHGVGLAVEAVETHQPDGTVTTARPCVTLAETATTGELRPEHAQALADDLAAAASWLSDQLPPP